MDYYSSFDINILETLQNNELFQNSKSWLCLFDEVQTYCIVSIENADVIKQNFTEFGPLPSFEEVWLEFSKIADAATIFRMISDRIGLETDRTTCPREAIIMSYLDFSKICHHMIIRPY